MADIKVSELNETTTLNDSDLLMIVQSNENKKVTAENIKKNINAYSLDEVEIGTWNNQPLYRKILSFNDTITGNTTFSIAHNIQNGKFIMVRYGGMYNTSNGASYPFNIVGYGGNLTDKGYCYADRTKLYIYANGEWNYQWYKVFVLEYTKNE